MHISTQDSLITIMSNLKRKEKMEKKVEKRRKMIILTKRRKSRRKSPFLAITTPNRSPQPDSGNT
jgi:hypothetical protein